MDANQALIIKTDGTTEIVDYFTDNEYDMLRDAVGGYIEAVTMPDSILWVNEEGKIHGLPVNTRATAYFQQHFGPCDIIVGNAVITGREDDLGNCSTLDPKIMNHPILVP